MTSTVSQRWGAVIKRRRLALGLTQVQLAEQVNAQQPSVSSWEAGRETPASRTQEQLVRVLGVTADELASIYGVERVA